MRRRQSKKVGREVRALSYASARRCFVSRRVRRVQSDACVRARLRALAQEISISSLMETANRGTNKMRGRGANPPSRRPVRMDDEADMKSWCVSQSESSLIFWKGAAV